jgi:hypothetical protein
MSYALPCRALPCRALPCRALPCRALPCRALLLIHDYSRPLTRPDWRHSKPIITTFELYLLSLIGYKYNILSNIKNTDWYEMYHFIKHNGIRNYCIKNNVDFHTIICIKGIHHALGYFYD